MNAHSRIVLEAQQLEIGYDQRIISSGLNISIPQGSFTVIIGPNASGKSTLLRALSRLLAPRHGNVLLEGQNIAGLKTKEIARRLGLLPQSSIAPAGTAEAR
jgi:iron complex transport system ATP-binding protein